MHSIRSVIGNLFLLFSCCFLSGCERSFKSKEILEKISFQGLKTEALSQIVEEIDYVILKNPRKAFVQVDKMFVTDESIVIVDLFGNQSLLHFESDGNFLNSIGKLGDGPEEYLNAIDVSYSSNEKLIEILSTRGIIQFGLDGNYISKVDLEFKPHRFLKIDPSHYVFYTPEIMASELRQGFGEDILYKYEWKSKKKIPLLHPIFPDVLNFMGDKNNLFHFGSQVVFSSSFCDTIYFVSPNSEKKKFFLEFGSSQIDLTNLYNLSAYQLVEQINSDDLRQKSLHVPHLFYNERYLTSSFLKDRSFHFFVYDLENKKTYLSSSLKNDLDSGPGLGVIKMMDEKYIYSVFEPEQLIQHAHKLASNPENRDDSFFNLIEDLSGDDFLVVAKYKLK
jgi:hypothetical protein